MLDKTGGVLCSQFILRDINQMPRLTRCRHSLDVTQNVLMMQLCCMGRGGVPANVFWPRLSGNSGASDVQALLSFMRHQFLMPKGSPHLNILSDHDVAALQHLPLQLSS